MCFVKRARIVRILSRACSRLRSSRQRSQYAEVRSRSKRRTVKRSPHCLQRTRRSFMIFSSMAQRSPRATVPPLNVHAYGELARTTANLNQVTRHLNEGGQLDAATAAGLAVVLERLGGEVRALRLGLLGIKGTEESSAGSSSAGCASASEQNP